MAAAAQPLGPNLTKPSSSGGRLEVQESDPEEPPAAARHRGLVRLGPPVRGARKALEKLADALSVAEGA